MTDNENLIQTKILDKFKSTETFFKDLLKSEKISIDKQYVSDDGAFCVDVLCIECTVKDKISFDDRRLTFNNGDKIIFNVTIEEEGFGWTSIDQLIHFADGNWDLISYEYIDFKKEYSI